MTTTTFTVVGMTCDHCVSSVRDELSKLDGVTAIDVDLTSGVVRVASTATLDAGAIAVAVGEAGYEVGA